MMIIKVCLNTTSQNTQEHFTLRLYNTNIQNMAKQMNQNKLWISKYLQNRRSYKAWELDAKFIPENRLKVLKRTGAV